ncbi:MAG: hypothetical protein HYR84_13630 [Planctomycetes bacterium]|nr:hypothetical protein [Planctomycetota bacterium]
MLRHGIVLLGVALSLMGPIAPAFGQRVLNETLAGDGYSEPIQLDADQIATWAAGDQQIFLMQGNVAIRQGASTIRSTDGIVWVDRSRYPTEKVLLVTVYGENPITLDRNQQSTKGDFGYVRLATRKSIGINSFKSEVQKADRSDAAVYRRALSGAPPDLVLAGREQSGRVDPLVVLAGGQEPRFPLQPKSPPMVNPEGGATPPPPPKFGAVPPPPDFGAAAPAPVAIPDAPRLPTLAATKPAPQISIRGRYFGDLQVQYKPLADGWTGVIVTGGVTLIVTQPPDGPGKKASTIDMEADRAVIWTRGNAQQLFGATRAEHDIGSGAHEVYLAGHVEIRSRTRAELETLRADEVYYDVRRGVAVARKADLEIQSAKLATPLHLVCDEFLQVNPKLYKAKSTRISASKLPSDPGLVVDVDDLTIEEHQKERTYLWGIPAYDKEGKRIVDTERYFTGTNLVARLEGVPFTYLPYARGNIEKPLGPLENVNLSYNRIFGFQVYTTWDMFDILNLPRPDGSRWRLMLDYLTARGPGLGTEYDFNGKDLFGVPSKYSGVVRLYGMFDRKADVLGGDRGSVIYWPDPLSPNPIDHPNFRGQAFAQINIQELPEGFSVLGQMSFQRDRNFLEQFSYNTHLNEMNQDTYLYVKQQQNNWAWSVQGSISTRQWMTETDWLPKADGYLLGQTFLDDLLVYNTHASAGFGRLRPTSVVPFAYSPTDVRTDTGRFDWMQTLSLPFYVGPIKLAPYAMLDTAYYTQDVNGNSRGRLYGGGGIRWDMPLSRVFPDVQSELFNLNGLDHKINLVGHYRNVYSSSSVNNFPQLDRLNDDVSDQALRDIRPLQTLFLPANAAFLTTSNLFNPQNYAIRRLLDSNVDTLDRIDVVQLGIHQRLQTQRGFAGKEHVIDWMTLNVDVSLFPRSQRDNFGRHFGIVEYDWIWNIGDRTALVSSGWFEPWDGGPRAFDVGAVLNRADATAFYFGYRQIDPLQTRAVVASITYPFSAKYAMQASTVWDFGTHVRNYSLFVSRMGTDVMVNFGLNYNSTLNTFGVAFEILPNMARSSSGRSAALFPMQATNIDPMINQR